MLSINHFFPLSVSPYTITSDFIRTILMSKVIVDLLFGVRKGNRIEAQRLERTCFTPEPVFGYSNMSSQFTISYVSIKVNTIVRNLGDHTTTTCFAVIVNVTCID